MGSILYAADGPWGHKLQTFKPPGSEVYTGDQLYRAGAQVYDSGKQSRDVRGLYLEMLRHGNAGKINAANNAMHADAMAQGLGDTAAGANQNSAADELTRRTTRAKGLSRLLMTTQNEGTSQLLRERLAAAQTGRQEQAAAVRAYAKRTEVGSGIQSGMAAVDAYNQAAKSNAFGQLAGAGIGGAIQLYKNYASPTWAVNPNNPVYNRPTTLTPPTMQVPAITMPPAPVLP